MYSTTHTFSQNKAANTTKAQSTITSSQLRLKMAAAAEEQQQPQANIYHAALSHHFSMSLKCAVELGIPDLIHAHGQPITLSDLTSRLSISPSKSSAFQRLMRLLAYKGYFATGHSDGSGEACYSLTPLSKQLLNPKDSPASLSSWLLAMVSPELASPGRFMSQWYRQADSTTTVFEMCHGKPIYGLAGEDPKFNCSFNQGMASIAHATMKPMLTECRDAFLGLRSLVDVGGGDGTAAKAIAEEFPTIRCTVFDLPHVIATVPTTPLLELVGGDMFDRIPPADAVFLKFILHNWTDQDCVKILKRCKEAIPSREDGGKVLISEIVVNVASSNHTTTEVQLFGDIMMLSLCGGREREEHEWKKIFIDAGFTNYKVTPLGVMSLIEVFP